MAAPGAVCPPQWAIAAPLKKKGKDKRKKRRRFHLMWALAAGVVCPPQWAIATPFDERKKRTKNEGRRVYLGWAMAAPGAVCPPQWAIAAPWDDEKHVCGITGYEKEREVKEAAAFPPNVGVSCGCSVSTSVGDCYAV